MSADAPPNPTPPATPAPRRGRRRALLLALLSLPALAGGMWWAWARREGPAPAPGRPTDDPRLAYAGPFRNVHPDVGYVGDRACAGCHLDKEETFRHHPMARSLAPAGAGGPPADGAHHNPFVVGGVRFEVVRRAGRLWHRQSRLDAGGAAVFTLEQEVAYVIGSGERGHSYLTARDGYLRQTPVSWFGQKHLWDLSPGFPADLFTGRPVNAECLFCHTNRANVRAGYVDRFGEPAVLGYGVGCERCHGPGALHVRERTRDLAVDGPVDYTIVNPRHLTPKLREAVCQQCHLEGEVRVVRRGRGLYDFRPGLPLEDFWAVFVQADRPGEERKVVSHVEQMFASKCFTGSAGTDRPLGCVSCHDPHVAAGPDRRVAHYRQACLSCHGEGGCSLPRAERLRKDPRDSCADCHMRRYEAEDVAHAAATDHTVPRRPSGDGGRTGHATGGLLVDFFRRRMMPEGPDGARDLGVALVRRVGGGHGAEPGDVDQAIGLLEAGLAEQPDDAPAWEAKGIALGLRGRHDEALASFRRALEISPRRTGALTGAATSAEDAGADELAVDYWRRAIRVRPDDANYYRKFATLLARKEQWDELGAVSRAWLRLNPLSIPARQALVLHLLRTGKEAEAKAEFDSLRRSRPGSLPELEQWFAREARRTGG